MAEGGGTNFGLNSSSPTTANCQIATIKTISRRTAPFHPNRSAACLSHDFDGPGRTRGGPAWPLRSRVPGTFTSELSSRPGRSPGGETSFSSCRDLDEADGSKDEEEK